MIAFVELAGGMPFYMTGHLQCLGYTYMKSREKADMIIYLIILLLNAMMLCIFYLYHHILPF